MPERSERRVVSTGMADRLAERQAMARHRTRQRAGVIAVLALLLAGGGWLVLLSPILAVDPAKVTITGEGTVIEPAAVRALVTDVDGVPLARLDTVALRQQILELRGVRDVRISRDWPDGLRVELVSREPVAAVPREGTIALLDVDGVHVADAETAPENLPQIEVPLEDSGGRALRAALTVVAASSPELRAQVATVSARSQDSVEMVLRDGVRVRWGDASQSALKVQVLEALRAAPGAAKATVFDVSAPKAPITR